MRMRIQTVMRITHFREKLYSTGSLIKIHVFTKMYFVLLQGGVILVSHDEHLIKMACKEVWLCKDKLVYRLEGGLEQYKKAIELEFQST